MEEEIKALEEKIESFEADNDSLDEQIESIKDEITSLEIEAGIETTTEIETGVETTTEIETEVETTTEITPTSTQKTTIILPDWIKENAKWWSSGAINDRDFSKGIEYMIKEEIIRIPQVQTEKDMGTFVVGKIPDWIKNNAKWWSEGLLSDEDFSKGLEYMVKEGIIKIQ